MHICIVTSSRLSEIPYGGVERFTLALGLMLARHGYRVSFLGRRFIGVEVTSPPALTNVAEIPGGRPRTIPRLPYWLFMLALIFYSLLLAIKLMEVNRKQRITVIHAQDTGYAGLGAILAGRFLNIPVVITSHGLRLRSLDLIIKGRLRSVCLAIERSIDRYTLNRARVIVAINEFVKTGLIQICGAGLKISVIPNAIDTRRFLGNISGRERSRLRMRLGWEARGLIFGYVGRFSPEKNLPTLLAGFGKALRRYSDMSLVVVGDGPLREQLLETASVLGIGKKVSFTGFRDDIDHILWAIDAFILTSYLEGVPTSVLEAMAAGKPIIASDIPAIRELLADFRCGIPIDPSDPDTVASAILKLCMHPNVRRRLGRCAIEAVSRYDIGIVGQELVNLYSGLARK